MLEVMQSNLFGRIKLESILLTFMFVYDESHDSHRLSIDDI